MVRRRVPAGRALPDDDGYLDRAIPPQWKNCTAVNKRYPHGVGRANAHDQVRGSTEPVTTFLHNTALYNTAMKFNKGLDRDKDGIAWEKA
ncbi:MAG TPA: excalibur calcium-binding domain-containing protein [Gaiellaceae bacterium]